MFIILIVTFVNYFFIYLIFPFIFYLDYLIFSDRLFHVIFEEHYLITFNYLYVQYLNFILHEQANYDIYQSIFINDLFIIFHYYITFLYVQYASLIRNSIYLMMICIEFE